MSNGATRIYQQRGFIARQRFSTAILLFAFFYGIWELVASFTQPDSANNALFGVLFIGASIYGVVRLMRESGDVVSALDSIDDGRRLAVTLWLPWGSRTIAGPREQFTNWRFYIAIAKRNQATPLIRFDHPDNKRPLTILLTPDTELEGLRKVAPDAVADYEERAKPKPQAKPA